MSFEFLEFVTLKHSISGGSTLYPKGNRGVVLQVHDDGEGYEVELEGLSAGSARDILSLLPDDLVTDERRC